jgi:anti-anti-sigma regulatory factor
MTGEPREPLDEIRYRLHQGPLTLSVRHAADGDRLVEAKGLIDDATSRALRAVLLSETEQGPVVLDGSGVLSCAASGAHVVVEAVGSAARHEQTLHVTPSSRALVAAFGKAAVAPPSGLFEQVGEKGDERDGERRNGAAEA